MVAGATTTVTSLTDTILQIVAIGASLAPTFVGDGGTALDPDALSSLEVGMGEGGTGGADKLGVGDLEAALLAANINRVDTSGTLQTILKLSIKSIAWQASITLILLGAFTVWLAGCTPLTIEVL